VGYVIAPIPTARYFETAGLHVAVSSWTRTADNAIPARVKAAANYQNSRLALLQAKTDGYDDAILLNSDGSVAEGPGYTLFLVQDERPMTPSVTSNILEGVTRSTLLSLFPEALGLTVEQRQIDRTELWADVKPGSLYAALHRMEADEAVLLLDDEKDRAGDEADEIAQRRGEVRLEAGRRFLSVQRCHRDRRARAPRGAAVPSKCRSPGRCRRAARTG